MTGIDAARGLALLGMMATHTLPLFEPGPGAPPSVVGLVFSGRSAALFAVLAGIGLALLTGNESPHHGRMLGADRRSVTGRAMVILAAGLTLGMVQMNVATILVQYAALFLCLLPFLGLPLRSLAVWAVGWVVLSPIAAYLIRPVLAGWLGQRQLAGNPSWDSLQTLHGAGLLLADVFFTGYYPVFQWIGYLLIGLVIGRLELRRLAVQLSLIIGGALAAFAATGVAGFLMGNLGGEKALLATPQAARWPLESLLQVDLAWVDQSGSWWWLATVAPHSGTTLDLLQSASAAAAVVGLCLLLTRRLPRILLPLSGAGAMTLTLYTLHIWVLGLTVHSLPPGWSAQGLFLAHAAAALLAGTLFALLGWRGPLELLAHGVAAVAGARGRARRRPQPAARQGGQSSRYRQPLR
ncbi:MAG TPA: heparan-alpha-glucosaminide N-acetyltransferase domain-containing protein [Micrococcaceae bacterium]|jgi:hypothetical protein|nr:heparan-alpha-glucosaminide N-acetyltransferase domain-containing protein [Micrococcaceae bacterium]